MFPQPLHPIQSNLWVSSLTSVFLPVTYSLDQHAWSGIQKLNDHLASKLCPITSPSLNRAKSDIVKMQTESCCSPHMLPRLKPRVDSHCNQNNSKLLANGSQRQACLASTITLPCYFRSPLSSMPRRLSSKMAPTSTSTWKLPVVGKQHQKCFPGCTYKPWPGIWKLLVTASESTFSPEFCDLSYLPLCPLGIFKIFNRSWNCYRTQKAFCHEYFGLKTLDLFFCDLITWAICFTFIFTSMEMTSLK